MTSLAIDRNSTNDFHGTPASMGVNVLDDMLLYSGVLPSSLEAGLVRRQIYDCMAGIVPTLSQHEYHPAVTYWDGERNFNILFLKQNRHSDRTGWVDLRKDEPLPNWAEISMSNRDHLSLSQIGEVMDEITNSLNAGDFSGVNESLRHIRIDRMSIDAIVTVARVSFLARNDLRNWADFVQRARAEIIARGEEEENLEGLY
jgi:hypothetical protein